MRGFEIVTVLVAVGTAVGCGAGAETETTGAASGDAATADYIADLNDLCVGTAIELRDIQIDPAIDPVGSDQNVAVNEARAKALPLFEALVPPEDLAEQHERYVALRTELIVISDRVIKALDDDDDKALQAAVRDRDERSAELFELGAEMGVEECGTDATAEEIAGMKKTIEVVETTGDPSQCTELFTKAYLELAFEASVENCESFQDDYEVARSFEARDFTTVGPLGVVGVTPNGGESDGVPATYLLRLEDGVWKVDSIETAQ